MEHEPTLSLSTAPTGLDAVFAGRYRLLGALGSGGMGTVFRARDLELDEDVALKVLRSGLSEDTTALSRFRREVKLARRVTHVNVARTYDLGVHDGALFLTMELIEGMPLSQRLREQPLSLAEALRVGSEVARGLNAAHAVEVVHRDLKPENVMVSDDRVVITDFGIAQSVAFEGDGRATVGLVGTPAYMAPEQVEGKDLDGRADIYALGILLFEALTGRLPFDAPTPLALAAIRLSADPPDPRGLVPRLPAAIAELVLEMLARPRELRPPAQRVLARLEQLRGSAAPLAPGVPEPRARRGLTVALAPLEASSADETTLATELSHALAECVQTIEGVAIAAGEPDLILGGSVRVRRQRARVRLRLTDRSGRDLWVGSLDGTLEGELELEDEVMSAVRGALAGRTRAAAASPSGLGRFTTNRLDPEVRDLVARARRHLHSFLDPKELAEAAGLLEEAALRAPDEPAVQGALAFVLARTFVTADATTSSADLSRAEELCYRAIASDPTHPEALQALGMLRYVAGDMRGAARALREAVARAPESLEANLYLARMLDESGHAELARARWSLVERLQPTRLEPLMFRMRYAAFRGDLRAMDELADQLRELPGGRRYTIFSRGRFAMWWGDREGARRCLEWVDEIDSEIAQIHVAPMMQMVLGERTLDEAWLETALRSRRERSSRRMESFSEQLATETLLAQGQLEAGLRHLERAAALPLIDVVWLDQCPLIAPVRDDPRFAAARAAVTARIEEMWS